MKKKKLLFALALALAIFMMPHSAAAPGRPDYPFQPVPFTKVQLSDSFWAPRLEINRTVTIPFAFGQCEITGRVRNFELAAGQGQGAFCTQYAFDDSDIYKVIEGASYTLAIKPDPKLDLYLDALITKVAAAQEKDGYLYTARTIDPAHPPKMSGKERFSKESDSHELYNMGHLYEAAYAHFQATGKRQLLGIALKNADFLVAEFGPDKRRDPPGHQVIEIGLAKLYRLTGNDAYLRLAKFFLAERGNASGHTLYGEYSQDHLPVLQQVEAVGHAVRAAYMYAGMADVAALSGDTAMIQAIDRLWEDVVGRKIYLTGGIGSTGAWEGFGPAFHLPNASAYAETCAAIAMAMWNHRMFLLHGDGKYIDVLERILYNGALSGFSLTGERFFYPNPLTSFGQHARSPWFTCACCPSNITRFLPSIPGYAYAQSDLGIYVNLYAAGRAEIDWKGEKIALVQETEYPWEGRIRLRILPAAPTRFRLMLRIPGWSLGRPIPGSLYRSALPATEPLRLSVNGQELPFPQEKGYALIEREWRPGDEVVLVLPMSPRRVLANEAVAEDRGRVAVERGPLVYCAEWPDNGGRVLNLVLEDGTPLTPRFRPDLLGGIVTIEAMAKSLMQGAKVPIVSPQRLILIPYYSWAHRGKGEMTVWLARSGEKARAAPAAGIASRSRVSASGGTDLPGLNDGYEPEQSGDTGLPFFHWWPRKGTREWVEYDFPDPVSISAASVYWFDDDGEGECRVPSSWRLLYRSGESWMPVKNLEPYETRKDAWNKIRFEPLTTNGVRLEVQLPEGFSSGIQEWRLEESPRPKPLTGK